jgi:hypothetical protein
MPALYECDVASDVPKDGKRGSRSLLDSAGAGQYDNRALLTLAGTVVTFT